MFKGRGEILLHILVWLVVFTMPHIDIISSTHFELRRYIITTVSLVSLGAIFYVNYLWFIPHMLDKNQKKKFHIINTSILLVIIIISYFWHTVVMKSILGPEMVPHLQRMGIPPPNPHHLPIFFLCLRNAIIYSLIVLSARIITRSKRLKQAEQERELAELQSIRNQVSPHFLLNTLNNIYALIQIRPDDAQNVVMRLSSLLRNLLYYDKAKVTLQEDTQFISDYIELMRIRLSDNVKLHFNTNIPEECHEEIASHLTISLVENAFKHGVSPTKPCEVYISITYDASKHSVSYYIRNTNFPKTVDDKSGHGVGLKVVRRRLNLSYPNRYTWNSGLSPDNLYYESHLTIMLY